MHNYKSLLIAIVCGILSGIPFLYTGEVTSLLDVINKLSFSEFYIDATYIAKFFVWYFPLMIFQIVWGTYIYRHFCTASVYYFSRLKNRITWFAGEIPKLYLYILLYLTVLLVSCMLPMLLFRGIVVDSNSIIILIYYYVIQSLWLYITTMLINILSIKWGSSIGFVLVSGVQIFFIGMFAPLQSILNFDVPENLEFKSRILKLNPISHLVLNWHSSSVSELNGEINKFDILFDLNESVVLFLFLSVIVSIIGCFVVKRQEFITINRETGGTV